MDQTDNCVDTIILAGEGSGSRKVAGKSKSSLIVEELPLLVHVIQALELVARVNRICIVGPKNAINEILANYSSELIGNKKILVTEQRGDLYQNFMVGLSSLIPEYQPGMEEEIPAIKNKQVFTIPVDLPLISPKEIDEFLDNASKRDLDYCIGMTEEEYLRPFYPDGDRPGIIMNLLHLKEGSFRLNNLHLARPFRIENRRFIEKLYQRRHQRRILNIVATLYDFIVTERMGLRPIGLFIMLEMSVLLRHLNMQGPLEIIRNRCLESSVTRYACKLLKTRVGIVKTTQGGCAIDIDSEDDFSTVQTRYREWHARQTGE